MIVIKFHYLTWLIIATRLCRCDLKTCNNTMWSMKMTNFFFNQLELHKMY